MAELSVNHRADNAALIDFAEKHLGLKHERLTRDDLAAPVDIAVVPRGLEVKSLKPLLDEYRLRPERRKGTATVQDLASLIALTKRFADIHSAIFAVRDPAKPSITTVLDYHEIVLDHDSTNALPRFGQHRIHYPLPLSEEWKVWTGLHGKKLNQADFAEVIEDRIDDVLDLPNFLTPIGIEQPDPAVELSEAEQQLQSLARTLGTNYAGHSTLMALSRGLQIHAEHKAMSRVNLATGEDAIVFQEEHKGEDGGRLKVPGLFLIAIPVFDNGDRYRIAVRLRYRLLGGVVNWFFELYRHDRVWLHAFDQVTEETATATGLPLYLGTPE